MKYLSDQTLAYYNAMPEVHRHDVSGFPLAVLARSTSTYRQKMAHKKRGNPDEEALNFYALNHCASIVRRSFTENEVLPPWAVEVMDLYRNVLNEHSLRMLHYIMLITTREMRHMSAGAVSGEEWKVFSDLFGEKMPSVIQNITNHPGEEQAMQQYLHNPPEVTLGQYVGGISHMFHNWHGSHLFGGHPWGKTMDAVVSWVQGISSLEMLIDTGWTLAHNNGPIFNKSDVQLYDHYSGNFMKILDVQRSGQVPDLILDSIKSGVVETWVSDHIVKLVQKHLPNEFKGYVNWYDVISVLEGKDKAKKTDEYTSYAGQHENYTQKEQQVKKTIKKSVTKKVKPQAPKTVLNEPTQVDPHKTVTGVYEVWPGVKVPIYTRLHQIGAAV